MDALAPIPHSGSRDADGLRAAELEHAVQGMDGHGDLGGLMAVRVRAERVANHPLVAGDRYLGQSATMVAWGFLPAQATALGDEPKVPIALGRRGRGRRAWHRVLARRYDDPAAGWRSATTPDTSSRS